ncbi:MAG: ATP-dependent RecD-like DNA helicase [Clostridiaceae bacterium]|nr:ATP-dependent RecD-like DNA helicase [Clostridiaceae bacterium]MBW4860025.1 ATP-dependent RecD-like DNA helicase [Clostridiaceae bacterium]MBW4867115.1 ATP-dependent RecD-like DNA helicase [Clostridiaceae bacterium]
MITVEGIVEDIIFRNESNGFTVAKLHAEEDSITIVGNIPFLNIGQSVEVAGEMIYHPNYGEQIKIENVSTITPNTLDGIEKYLSSGLIPHVGKKTAKKIVERFGKDSLEIIEYYPERLKEIEGIGDKKVKKISEAFEEQRELRDIMVFLQQYGITANYGVKIYKKYGKDTINIISENPYRLSEDIFGIGFKKADEIAKNMGIATNSPYRVEAGIKFQLMKSSGNGHTYVPQGILIEESRKILEVEEELIEQSIRDLAIRKEIQLENVDGEIWVYYMPFYIAETNVSKKIVELSRVELEKLNIDVEEEINNIEDKEGIKFARRQREAIKESVENGMLIITGGPGTGKTTTINAIIKLFEEKELEVVLAAPTGRAAKRMSQATGREAKTIHRLLEYSFMEDEMGFGRDEGSPLEADVVIIDETSMVDIILMNNLLKAIMAGTRVIFVGDTDQLPSVGPGNVLKDIINSGVVKVVKLDEIFRQAEESMIIVNAHKINKGEYPRLNAKGKDFYFIPKYNSKEIVDTVLGLCNRRLPKFNGYDSLKDIQVLTPMKKGDAGTNSLNKYLQEVLNPKGYGKSEKKIGDEIFRIGDKVMQIKNNYTTEWEIIENGVVKEKGEGVYNGDFGFIIDIDKEDEILKVLFDDEKEVEYDFSQLDELKLAYATTVHKSQGSEFPVVIMPICWGPPMLLTRNLLYTAITRAKELVVLVGEEQFLLKMIQNNRITKRYSGLDYRMKMMLTFF